MFRRLQDRFNSAVFGETDLERLLALGFTESQVLAALEASNGNRDRAVDLLLSQQQQQQTQTTASTTSNNHNDEDADLQRAMEQSRVDEQERRRRAEAPVNRTAAMQKAAAAAMARNTATNTSQKRPASKTTAKKSPKSSSPSSSYIAPVSSSTATTTTLSRSAAVLRDYHPDVQLLPRLQDKTIEEQLLRTAQRLQPYPAAIDILHKALSALRKSPNNPKFTQIDTSTRRYQQDVENAVGAADFLRAVSFSLQHNHKWRLDHYDPARVYLAISALEKAQLSNVYQTTKLQNALEKEVQECLDAQQSQQQPQKEENVVAHNGTRISVQLTASTTVHRRFEGDDTVQDIMEWLASTFVPILPARLQSQTWKLVNKNTSTEINVNGTTTLQVAGLWPSGRILLQPYATTDEK